ncbi:hypothetical protein [Streptomyces sp. NBC_00316]|uniref:hypothetical protein n=1 Tax=Streptomyces sp. NBC_00316 TaxID=2975710 RepID=UPI002E2DEA8E|nr:hypothetical protein [Streptomyces sp. NBC_00316]
MPYFIGLFFVAGSTYMTWKATQLWRHADLVDFFIQTLSFMPFGKEVKRGEIRSLGLTAVSLWGVTTLLLMGLLDVEMTGPTTVLFAITTVIVLLCLLCEISVILFNAPKIVVPPHMRSDPGLLAARKASRSTGPKRLKP